MRFVKPSWFGSAQDKATWPALKGAGIALAALALVLASAPVTFVHAKPATKSLSLNALALAEDSTASEQAASGKAPAKTPAKPAEKAPPKAQQKAPAKAKSQVQTAQAAAPSLRRDPFQPLISKTETKAVPDNLPPGPGGLMVSTMRLEGIVRSPSGMIAVVSNPQQRVYFVREGASLYDGTVEKISLDSITLRERGKDPFGKPVDRQVVKRLYPRAGEQ